jgi:GntR family transcriptional regulator, uxu operon transcriptional repressor
MILPTIQPKRLYRQIADLLANHIRNGEFPAGSYLPSERDLAKQLGVSRSSVREALIALEVSGLVEIRVGNGVYVCDQSSPAIETDASAESPFALLEARSLFEGEIAALAAQKATPEQIAQIEKSITAMAGSLPDHNAYLEQDHLFHRTIAEATGNDIMVALVEHLWELRRSSLFHKFEEHYTDMALKGATIDDHATILEAIKAGDARKARAAMKSHMTHIRNRFSK